MCMYFNFVVYIMSDCKEIMKYLSYRAAEDPDFFGKMFIFRIFLQKIIHCLALQAFLSRGRQFSCGPTKDVL